MTLESLLARTSRSFYLSLRILPATTRGTVGLAYLLARAADSIADTGLLPPAQRAELLAGFLDALGGSGRAGYIDRLARALPTHGGERDEHHLLLALAEAFAAADTLPDRELVRDTLRTIVTGMQLDLQWFPQGKLCALRTREELDRYCWHVAGVVGRFWTELHARRYHDVAPALAGLGIDYGKALQRINILRDLPRDLRRGRCYLPHELLATAGLEPAALLDPSSWPRLQPIYHALLDETARLLASGRAYARRIPRRRPGLHLASRWPYEIGRATLARLSRAENPLDPARRIKVGRRAIYAIVTGSMVRALLDSAT